MKNLKVAFFTEAGSKRGMGHLMRSRTIYNAFLRKSIPATFYLDSDIDFSYKFSDITYFNWDNFSYYRSYDIVFIDSYIASINIYNQLAENSRICVYFDDYSRLKYPNGIILNIAPDANNLFFKLKSSNYTYLLGLDYVPIRQEFQFIKKNEKDQIFIMLGGNDVGNHSLNIINSLIEIDIKKVLVTNNLNIKKSLENKKNHVVLYKPSDKELITYMSSSSIAISTSSMTVYELAYYQIPTIIIATNKNQEIGSTQFLKHNLAYALVNMKSLTWDSDIKTHILNIKHIKQNSKPSVNSKGVEKILDITIGCINS